MYIIEKCTQLKVNATYAKDQKYLWMPAWPGMKARFDCRSIDEAIQIFEQRTSKVKTTPYRLRIELSTNVIAAVNCLDVDRFRKFTISAIGFYPSELDDGSVGQSIEQTVGAVVPGTMGTVVGASTHTLSSMHDRVDEVAKRLSRTVSSHKVTTRYNSNGMSGGAYLVTSVTSGIFSNSDIGISCSQNTDGYVLTVSHKFLASPESPDVGNKRCSLSLLWDHMSEHDSIDGALARLKQIARIATEEELAALRVP